MGVTGTKYLSKNEHNSESHREERETEMGERGGGALESRKNFLESVPELDSERT